MATSPVDIAWAAGFMEGEGSFQPLRATKSGHKVTATQKQKEPLERLQRMFGGRLYFNPVRSGHWRWDLCGPASIGVAMTLFTFMSPRRKDQIRTMLADWKAALGKGWRRDLHGHKSS